MKLAENLKEARKSAKITQVNLAKMCNVSQGTIANWESGTRTPDPETIAQLAEILNVTPAYLMGWGENEQAEDPKLNKAVALINSLNDIGQEVAIQRLEELNEIGKYKLTDDQSDGNSSILFILTAAIFMMLLHLVG